MSNYNNIPKKYNQVLLNYFNEIQYYNFIKYLLSSLL